MINPNDPRGNPLEWNAGFPPEEPYINSALTIWTWVHDATGWLDKGFESIDLPSRYKKIHSGKVRDTYEHPDHPEYSIIVATDRISTHDVVHNSVIPNKGVVLTQMSRFWFNHLKNDPRTSNIATHLPTDESIEFPQDFPLEHRERAMVVRRLSPLPVEGIVRGYLFGSVTKPDGEYTVHGTVGWVPVPLGKKKCYKFDEPIFAPSTKGAAGAHDENMTWGVEQMVHHLMSTWESPQPIEGVTEVRDESKNRLTEAKAREIAQYMQAKSVLIYKVAQEHAQARGITLWDTKFEWGLDITALSRNAPIEQCVVLIDEVLTPDSSRFWESDSVVEWKEPRQHDKQPARDEAMAQWKAAGTLETKPPLSFPDHVIHETQRRYTGIQACITNMLIPEFEQDVTALIRGGNCIWQSTTHESARETGKINLLELTSDGVLVMHILKPGCHAVATVALDEEKLGMSMEAAILAIREGQITWWETIGEEGFLDGKGAWDADAVYAFHRTNPIMPGIELHWRGHHQNPPEAGKPFVVDDSLELTLARHTFV